MPTLARAILRVGRSHDPDATPPTMSISLALLALGSTSLPPADDGLEGTEYAHAAYGLTSGPTSMAVADIDEDGHVDYVVSFGGAHDSVKIHWGGANATFAAATHLGMGSSCRAVAVGDFDGDGGLDVAASIGGGDYTVATYEGGRLFGSPTLRIATPYNARQMWARDLNSDGRDDLVVVPSFDLFVDVYFGMSDGTFGPATRIDSPSVVWDTVVDDFDADGHVDIAVGDGGHAVTFAYGDGVGAFQLQSYPTGASADRIRVRDVTGDGVPDIVVLDDDQRRLALLAGSGPRQFDAAETFPLPPGSNNLELADVDEDGSLDFLIARRGNSFRPGGLVTVIQGVAGRPGAELLDLIVGNEPGPLDARDLDHDGHIDLASLNLYGRDLTVLRGQAGAAFETSLRRRTYNAIDDLDHADFDGDGHIDLVVCGEPAGFGIHRGVGDGTFLAAGAGIGPYAVGGGYVSDVNGDGHPDYVHWPSFGPDRIVTALNDGTGSFQLVPSSPLFAGPVDHGDVNGDGVDDIVSRISGNYMGVTFGASDGTFTAGPRTYHGLLYDGLTVGDLNGDGMADVVTYTYQSSTIKVYLGHVSGAFILRDSDLPVPFRPWHVDLGDTDGDGWLDIVVAGFGDPVGEVFVYGNDAGTGVSPRGGSGALKGLVRITMADVDLDGRDDVVGYTPRDVSEVVIMHSNELGIPTFAGAYLARADAIRHTVADVNGDGNPDVVVANRGSDDLSILLHRASPRIDRYCTSSLNSTGAEALIEFDGSRSLSQDDSGLTLTGAPAGEVATFFSGAAPGLRPLPGGAVCIAGPLTRESSALPTTAFGSATVALDASRFAPGETRYFQCWYTDAMSASRQYRFSDAVAVLFCP